MVSHIRAVHSSELSYTCGVQGCLERFKKSATWYRHIKDIHHEDYQKVDPIVHVPCEEEHPEEDQENDMGMEFESLPELTMDTAPTTSFTENVVVGRLMRIKECHNLPQVVVDDVVELIRAICEDFSMKAQSSIQNCVERFGIDSCFFQEVSDIFQGLQIPLSSLETAYKQQAYIIKNLPYVVGIQFCH